METISHRGPGVSEQEAAGPIALTQTDGCQQGFLPTLLSHMHHIQISTRFLGPADFCSWFPSRGSRQYSAH